MPLRWTFHRATPRTTFRSDAFAGPSPGRRAGSREAASRDFSRGAASLRFVRATGTPCPDETGGVETVGRGSAKRGCGFRMPPAYFAESTRVLCGKYNFVLRQAVRLAAVVRAALRGRGGASGRQAGKAGGGPPGNLPGGPPLCERGRLGLWLVRVSAAQCLIQFDDGLYLAELVADLRHLRRQQGLLCGQHLQVVDG